MIYAPGSYAGYAAELLPGISESLDRNDSVALRQEAGSLAAALLRASARLDDVARLARQAAPAQATGAANRKPAALLVPAGAR
jgi:hypothetical protein